MPLTLPSPLGEGPLFIKIGAASRERRPFDLKMLLEHRALSQRERGRGEGQ